MKPKIVLDDPETRAIWRTALRARDEVASWPAWKRDRADAHALMYAQETLRQRLDTLGVNLRQVGLMAAVDAASGRMRFQ